MTKKGKTLFIACLCLLSQTAPAAGPGDTVYYGNLSITAVTVSPGPYCAGEAVSFTVTVLNTGPNALVNNPLSSSFGMHSVELAASTPSAGTSRIALGPMGFPVGATYTATVMASAPAGSGPGPWAWDLELQASYQVQGMIQLQCIGCPPPPSQYWLSQRWPLRLSVDACLPSGCSGALPANGGMESSLAPKGSPLNQLGLYGNWYIFNDLSWDGASSTLTARSGNNSLKLEYSLSPWGPAPFIRLPRPAAPVLSSGEAIQDLCVDPACPATLCLWGKTDNAWSTWWMTPISGAAKVSLLQLDSAQNPISGAASVLLTITSTAWVQACLSLGSPSLPYDPAMASLRLTLYGEATDLSATSGTGQVFFDDISLTQSCPKATSTPGINEELLVDKGAYPVPFQDQLHLIYHLRADADLQLRIYNAAGEPVYKRDWNEKAGVRELSWKGDNEVQARCSSGVYLVNLKAKTPEGRQGKLWRTVAIAR